MQQKYLVPPVGRQLITVPSTAGLREKWIGAMLDKTGRAYAGALRLDFSPSCESDKALNAVADTLARHPILAAHFQIEGDILVGYAPTESSLREVLREQMRTKHTGITNEAFLAHRARQSSEPGLRLASVSDDNGLHVWIGFWTYTCDGASIDLLIEEIANRYLGKSLKSSRSWEEYAQMEVTQTVKQVLDSRTRVNVYPVPGPYGIDAVRATPRGTVGHTQSVRFDSPIPRSMVLTCARAYRVTPFVLLFAAFQRAVSAVSGVKTVVTGVPFANRRHPDDHTVVGPLSNTVPITTHHELGEPLVAVLNQVQRAVIRAAERQNIETTALYPEGTSPRNVDYDLPFPQLFNAWNSQRDGTEISLGKTEWMYLRLLPNGTCRAGFEITLDEHSEYISGRIDMDVEAYDGQVEQVIEHMIKGLNSLNSN
ncbi:MULTISPECIES: condensation domain-containing protein [Bacillus amyloliquefaciens group]|nr:condensation domain-containing protein [Bacillus velezensis]MBC2598630.1 non-ribosomal peptide synthase [Bacillus velezensis]MBU5239902.1 hypothetical protein [Bacillus velezensis]MCM3369300.1 condensation domain-containing protein [Bacillus velezensis]QDF56674.1 putative NRPS related protein with condensation domain [Bacillus velezensis]CDG26624.1 putative NRPS related protein with condensation domain [Bacillus velezensis UCMB5113]